MDDEIVASGQSVDEDLDMGTPLGAPGAIDDMQRSRVNPLTLDAPREGRQMSHGDAATGLLACSSSFSSPA